MRAVEVARAHDDPHLHVYLINHANIVLSNPDERPQMLLLAMKLRQEVCSFTTRSALEYLRPETAPQSQVT